jgi:hypothetical protein
VRVGPVPQLVGVSSDPTTRRDVALSVAILVLAIWTQRWVLDLQLTAIDTIPTLAAAKAQNLTEVFDVLFRELRGGVTGGEYYRPLTLVSYTLDEWVWGGSPWGYHLTDLILHGLAGVSVFWLARVAVDLPRLAAFFAASLFLIHPATIEVVPAIARRQEPLLVIGFCLAVLGGRHLPQRVGWLLVILGSLIAVTSVERGLAVPGVVLGYLFCYRFAGLPFVRRVVESVRWTLPAAGVAVGFYLLHLILYGNNGAVIGLNGLARIPLKFGLHLLYPQQFFNVAVPTDARIAAIYLGAAVLVSTVFVVPILRALRRTIVWFSLSWIASFVLLLSLVGIYNPWYVYTAVPALALIIVFFAVEAHRYFVSSTSRKLRASLATVATMLLAFTLIVPSPILREYPAWRVASELSERFLEELGQLSRVLPAGSSIVIFNLPAHYCESESDYLVTRSAAILWPSSVEVWRSQHGIDLDVKVVGSANFVGEIGIPEIEIGEGGARVFFVDGKSRYTNSNGSWPRARPLPESAGRGFSFPWPNGPPANASTRVLVFDGQRLIPLQPWSDSQTRRLMRPDS